MAYIVDQLFPPVNDREESVEFSSFNFWREPVIDINCEDILDVNVSPSGSNIKIEVPRVQRTPPTPVAENDLSTVMPTIPEKA